MPAGKLGKWPNKVSIEGHTDSKPYAGIRDYGNWGLSTDRANAARRCVQYIVKDLDEDSTKPGDFPEGANPLRTNHRLAIPQITEESPGNVGERRMCASLFPHPFPRYLPASFRPIYSGKLRRATVLARLFQHARGCSFGVRKSSNHPEGEYRWELS
jgi:hypothetical protein